MYRRYLVMALGDALLGGRGRDLEMTLVGHLAPRDADLDKEKVEAVCSAIRLYGLSNRWTPGHQSDAKGQPRRVIDYLHRVATRHGWDPDALSGGAGVGLRGLRDTPLAPISRRLHPREVFR
jgi:hypothetical protein